MKTSGWQQVTSFWCFWFSFGTKLTPFKPASGVSLLGNTFK